MTNQTNAVETDTQAPETPQGAADFLANLMSSKVDASLPADAPGKSVETPEADDGKTAQAEKTELDSSNAVIASKDGKYVIEYEKLTEARNGRTTALARVTELEALLKAASERVGTNESPTQADTNAAIAQQAIDAGANPEIFGDFSEQAIANGVNQLVDARVDARMKAVDAKLEAVLSPLQQKHVVDATQAHQDAIYGAHADADSIVESKEFADWVAGQPTFARNAFIAVLDPNTGGSAQQVIELFDAFKKAMGAAAPAETDVRAAAKAAIAKAGAPVPTSLSDIPGGRSGATDRFEALDAMAPHEQMNALMKLSQADRNAYMNR